MKPLRWMTQPIKVDWLRQIVVTAAGAFPRYGIRATDRARVQQEQRDRAASLMASMGFRTDLSPNQAAKILEVLGPFVPGLTIAGPEDLEVPAAYSLAWVKPNSGRKGEWPRERLLALRRDVDAVLAAGKLTTDRAAIRLLINDARVRGGDPFGDYNPKTLANRLTEARSLPA